MIDLGLFLLLHPGAKFHDFHHYNFVGNYSSSFMWWDWLFGTDRQYREYQVKMKQKKALEAQKKSQ